MEATELRTHKDNLDLQNLVKAKLIIITTLQQEKSELEVQITAVKDSHKQDRKALKQIKEEKIKYMEKLLETNEELNELKKTKEAYESQPQSKLDVPAEEETKKGDH